MLFTSSTFLYIFLPLVLIGSRLAPTANFRNLFLLAASLIFYCWGELDYLPLILIAVGITHLGSVYLVSNGTRKGAVLALTVALLLALLGYFKYYGFVAENLQAFGWTFLPQIKVDLPLGISFFTFHAISQVVNVYRNPSLPKFRNLSLVQTALYILLFPQLIAGPIVRFGATLTQMGMLCATPARRAMGAKLFIVGLAMKVIIADKLAPIADHVFALGAALDPSEAWLGAISYALQIFFDFAGYSNMAIGLGIYLGFSFPTNFRDPYVSLSITEFWRRWHISLSSWFRDYLYIPLGGNRLGQGRTLLNLFAVFLATGIWHGAAWNFIVWGMWHGFFIIAERVIGRPSNWLIGRIYTLLVVVTGWVMFRAATFGEALDFLARMFGTSGDGRISLELHTYMQREIILILGVGLFFALIPRPLRRRIWQKIAARRWVSNLFLTLLLVLCMMYVATSTYSPFLYFRF
jgi:alginate O-acetyltransferase complex protein AlgI